jgi:hypothetical protein
MEKMERWGKKETGIYRMDRIKENLDYPVHLCKLIFFSLNSPFLFLSPFPLIIFLLFSL